MTSLSEPYSEETESTSAVLVQEISCSVSKMARAISLLISSIQSEEAQDPNAGK